MWLRQYVLLLLLAAVAGSHISVNWTPQVRYTVFYMGGVVVIRVGEAYDISPMDARKVIIRRRYCVSYVPGIIHMYSSTTNCTVIILLLYWYIFTALHACSSAQLSSSAHSSQ